METYHFPHRYSAPAAWAEFDADWYSRHYLDGGAAEAALEHYYEVGARAGHSPNPYFDEQWYRLCHPEVAVAIASGELASGFSDYCKSPDDGRKPHWLFDAEYYVGNGGPAAGHANAYDGFLKLGDAAGFRPSVFFDPRTYLASLPAAEQRSALRIGCYRYVLSRRLPGSPEPNLSPFFDPVWYLRQYPDAAVAVLRRKVPSALAHYLLHRGNRPLDPLEQFSEGGYLDRHADVAEAVRAGVHSCGYAHFLDFGYAEGRSYQPDESREDSWQSSWRGILGEPSQGRLRRADVVSEVPAQSIDETAARQLFAEKAAHAARAAAREPIDFSCDHEAAVSVIMVLHNKFDLTLAVLAELQDQMPGRLEVILVDSGSTDETRSLADYVRGARIIRFDQNVNFIHASNAGLSVAKSSAVLFLNNDVRLGPRAIARAYRRLNSAPDIGAVGGMVIRSHGRLQEAGCIIWRDGFTDGYLRDASPLAPEANLVREVDFCSGVFLMVRYEPLKRLGGFDPVYSPAYFEETDLCVRLRMSGWRVIYDPAVRIEHLEYGSAVSANDAVSRIRANQRIFSTRHADWLTDQPDRANTTLPFARIPRESRGRKQVLMIEDRLPFRRLGSGFVRSNDIVRVIAEMGYGLTIFPTFHAQSRDSHLRREFPDTVEVIDDRGLEALPAFLAEREGYYNHIWIGRTHNLDRLAPTLSRLKTHERPKIILDTEAVAATRAAQRAALDDQPFDLDEAIGEEFRNIAHADSVVTVNAADAHLLQRAGFAKPTILGHMRLPRKDGPSFAGRHDLLFVGAMHGNDSPNLDALGWFFDHVLPKVVAKLGPGIRLTVIGHISADVDLSRFAAHTNVQVLGSQSDLEPQYDRHRVFIAPTRIASGMPYKLHEAASEGIPIVATDLLAKQLGWVHGRQLLTAPTNDPAAFAAAVVRAYEDPSLWSSLREAAWEGSERDSNPDTFVSVVCGLLN